MAKWEADDRAQLHKDANKALDEQLAPGEQVNVIIRGTMNSALIGTDRRVFVFKKGFISRGMATFDYEDISGVIIQTGWVQGYVALQGPGLQTTNLGHGSKEVSPDKVPHALSINEKEQAQAGVALLRKVLGEFHETRQQHSSAAAPDVMDQLRKLAELRDAGILTSDEFENKKAELLSRL